jgi:hypothetical protein
MKGNGDDRDGEENGYAKHLPDRERWAEAQGGPAT